jgi:hypothetical protein
LIKASFSAGDVGEATLGLNESNILIRIIPNIVSATLISSVSSDGFYFAI